MNSVLLCFFGFEFICIYIYIKTCTQAFKSLVEKTKTSSVLRLSAMQCDAKAVSTIAHAAAGLGIRDVSVAAGVVAAASERLQDFDRQGVANLAWALAKMPKVKGRLKLAKELASRSHGLLSDFSPQELCNVLWALGKLGVRDNKLMSLASDIARGKLDAFTPQGLSMLAASYARVGIFNESLLEEIRSKAEAQLVKLNSRDAAQLVGALVISPRGLTGDQEEIEHFLQGNR